MFRAAVDRAPAATWLLAGDEEYSYGQALEAVGSVAASLRHAGVGVGQPVMVTARNTADYLFAWLALMEVGAVAVPVNPRSTAPEFAGLLGQVLPAVVVTDDQLRPAVAAAGRRVASAPGVLDVAALRRGGPDGRGPADREPEDLAVLMPTSGTTGRSKLVMQTHLTYVLAGEGFPWWLGLTADDRLMTSLPLFHVNAPAYSVLGSVAAGASLVLLPSFSARGFLDAARHYRATEFNSIGAMLEILMGLPEQPDDADTPLRLCYTGPSPSRERHLEIERRFGLEVVCGYALSESTYGLVWARGTRPYGTLGSPRQHPELGHVNDARVMEDGRPVPPGAVGELELRNPAVMRGYHRMPEETAAVLVDGWLRTGDLVRDEGDGTYTFVGRRKEVIRRRGENLSPAEVEAVLEGHPDVAEAAVVGVPSELGEEEVKAFVVPAPGRAPDPASLRALALEHLARYKAPRYVEVVAELPHTPTGRLAKHRLPTARTAGEVDLEAGAPAPGHPLTRIGSAGPDHITVAGRDLPTEVMGRLTLTELAYLLLTGREPTPAQRRMCDAVLVSLADHGLTPSALSARLTFTGAPESVQGAVAAGLLGAGRVLLGPAGDTAEFLAGILAGIPAGPGAPAGPAAPAPAGPAGPAPERPDAGAGGEVPGDEALAEAARAAVARRRAAGARIPGLGHPVHRVQDPRTPRIYQLAAAEGLLGPHLRLLRLVADAHAEAGGRRLPVNGAGAGGAALADAGLPPSGVRGFVLIARTAGLVAHVAEEAERPIGMSVWQQAEGHPPPPPG